MAEPRAWSGVDKAHSFISPPPRLGSAQIVFPVPVLDHGRQESYSRACPCPGDCPSLPQPLIQGPTNYHPANNNNNQQQRLRSPSNPSTTAVAYVPTFSPLSNPRREFSTKTLAQPDQSNLTAVFVCFALIIHQTTIYQTAIPTNRRLTSLCIVISVLALLLHTLRSNPLRPGLLLPSLRHRLQAVQ